MKILSIVVCTYNRFDYLFDCIESLRGQEFSENEFEIIVVDNSLKPSTSKGFKESLPEIANLEYYITDKAGLSYSRNYGLDRSHGKYVAFIDDDAVAEKHWAKTIVQTFEDHTSAGSVGGKVIPIWSEERPPWLDDSLLKYLSVVDWSDAIIELDDTQWLVGTNVAYVKDLLLELGGFRSDLGRKKNILMGNEEIEVTRKIASKGFKVIYNPGIVVKHLIPQERISKKWLRQRTVWQAIADAFMNDGQFPECDEETRWHGTTRYFNNLPPYLRTPRGYFYDTDDPDLFYQQLAALYNSMLIFFRGEQ